MFFAFILFNTLVLTLPDMGGLLEPKSNSVQDWRHGLQKWQNIWYLHSGRRPGTVWQTCQRSSVLCTWLESVAFTTEALRLAISKSNCGSLDRIANQSNRKSNHKALNRIFHCQIESLVAIKFAI